MEELIYTQAMKMQEYVSLKKYSTYAIGGEARYFCQIENEGDVREAIKFANENQLQIFVLGGGSNLIISDKGFDGLVIRIQNSKFKIHESQLTVGAGVSMPELVEITTSQGLAGLEWAGGLPGSLGGAIFGNAGCFGHEIKEVVKSVRAIDFNGVTRNFTNEECEFTYRASKFKRQGIFVILEAKLALKKGNAEELKKDAQEKMTYRKTRHPIEYPNIGSIFKNIEQTQEVAKIITRLPELENDVKTKWYGKIPVAVLIEKIGFKGRRNDGIQISDKHANFLINMGEGTSFAVANLIKEIKAKVKNEFDIELEEEVRYVGFKDNI